MDILPTIDPARSWTEEEVSAFPLWGKVCYSIKEFNTRITTLEQWCYIFPKDEKIAKEIIRRLT
jgi:hypothetical protein